MIQIDKLGEYDGLHLLLNNILNSCVEIKRELERSPLYHMNHTESTNTSGDIQKPLDILSNDLIIENIRKNKCAKYLYSEELEDCVIIEDGANYTVCFDPLDGSSNIDCNVSIGTIFSIYRGDSYIFENMILSGYVIYGFTMELMITFKKGKVMRFVYHKPQLPRVGKINQIYWIYIGNVEIPKNIKKTYCINHGNQQLWNPKMCTFIQYYQNNKYSQRYVGSMVADIHRTLLYGGFFSYPTDEKNKSGKLRLLYECIPMSMIIENAGGIAVDEECKRICDIIPEKIHQKTGILMGSKEDIQRYIDL